MKARHFQLIRLVLYITLLAAVAGGSVIGTATAQSAGFVDVDVTTLDGSGTSDDPYQITNASELQAIEDDRTATYELTTDIDASGTKDWNNGLGFSPLHNDINNTFTGVFDGNGHSISGLYINRVGVNRVGLFAVVGVGEIKNVTIANADITGSDEAGAVVGQNGAMPFGFPSAGTVDDVRVTNTSVDGDENVGGIVGLNREVSSNTTTVTGVVRDSSTDGTVTGRTDIGGVVGNNSGSIEQSATAAGVEATDEYSGGLVGQNRISGMVINSSSTSDVGGNKSGGIAGINAGTILRSYARNGPVNGSVYAGGLVGRNTGIIENSYSHAPVGGDDGSTIGGLVGSLYSGTINSSYAAGDVTANGSVAAEGGVIGETVDTIPGTSIPVENIVNGNYYSMTTQSGSIDGVTERTAAEMTGDAAETNMANLDFETQWNTRPNGYPALSWEPTVTVEGSELSPSSVTSSVANHTLSLTIANASADGNSDEVSVAIPSNVRVNGTFNVTADAAERATEASTGEAVPIVGQFDSTNRTYDVLVNPTDGAANRDVSVDIGLQLVSDTNAG